MRRLNKDLSKDINNYRMISKSIGKIETRIKELDNVLQEATKNIVNISEPSQESLMTKLAEAKRCRNEAAGIKKNCNIMDPSIQARITALLAKAADIIS